MFSLIFLLVHAVQCDSGGNLSVAVGPIGRNAEASGSINKLATMYSYSRVSADSSTARDCDDRRLPC